MTAVLIANVGNRDVWVGKSAPIPGEVHPHWNTGAVSRRALGRALVSSWDACASHVELPIIGKAIEHVREEQGSVDRVVLAVSDQSGCEEVDEQHLAQDTCELEPVVRRLLLERHGLADEAIETLTVRDNPASYGAMRAFYRQHLPPLIEEFPEADFYLDLSGGTPAMASMLLVVGAEVLKLAAQPIYISERDPQPYAVDLGRRIVAESLCRVVAANLDIYAYHAAARAVSANMDLLREYVPADALVALLEYGHQRLCFNFGRARAALAAVAEGPWSATVEGLRADLAPQQTEWLLHEIVHNAAIQLRTGAYADFLMRVFRFDEASLRHATSCQGARFVDKKGALDPDGEYLDGAWVAGEPKLDRYLAGKSARRDVHGNVEATRFATSLVLTFLARQQGDQRLHDLRRRLNKIYRLSAIRNKSFVAHKFVGVSRQRMAQAVFGSRAVGSDAEMDQIVGMLEDACELATGKPMKTTNPFDEINRACRELLGT